MSWFRHKPVPKSPARYQPDQNEKKLQLDSRSKETTKKPTKKPPVTGKK